MRRIGVLSAVLLLSATNAVDGQTARPSPDVSPATIVTVPSVALAGDQQASVLLPAAYTDSRQRYPVLYLWHGGGQDHTAFAMRSSFRALAARELIIVTPNAGES
jgi:poly(3-hydroxybutyrate) depolymerase